MTESVYATVGAFAARLAARGVTDAVISPGSRSTPLTLCMDAQPGLRTWVQLDERAAGFFALGLGRATGRPAVLVCTSGTAAANYLPAVVEASHAGIAMIVCTADRPPELRGWGSPQTIDQVGLYGTAARWSVDLPVPDEATVALAHGWADTAVDRAAGADPGPVHLNWPLREPLEPPARAGGGDWRRAEPPAPRRAERAAPAPAVEAQPAGLADLAARRRRGVVVVGPWPGGGLRSEQLWAAAARRFASWAGWPLIAEPVTGGRAGRGDSESGGVVVTTADHLLSDETVGDVLRPDAAVLVGRTVTTKPVRLWLERTRPEHVVLIDPENRWERSAFRLTGHVRASVSDVASFARQAPASEAQPSIRHGIEPGREAPPEPSADRVQPGAWLDTWARLDATARSAIEAAVDDGPLLSARTARVLVAALGDDAVLVASNSMPVRDLDAFVFDTRRVVCCANRGAAGIDGTASTALGIAAADPSRTVALYTGDLALLHDLGGLTAAARLGLHLIAVCVDNDGGEIFSLLPVAERIPAPDFERLFRTAHGLDLGALDGFGGIRARRMTDAADLERAVRAAAASKVPGVDLLIVGIDRDDDVAQRRALTAAARQAAHRILEPRGSAGR